MSRVVTQVLSSLQRKGLSLLVSKSQHFHLLGGKQGCLSSLERGIATLCSCWGPGAALPLSHSEVARRAAAQVSPFRVGAAVAARVVGGGTLIHIMAGTGELVKGEPGGAGTFVTPQGVVAGSRATGPRVGALVLICQRKERSVYTGEDDAGEWSPRGLSVYRIENFKKYCFD